MIWTSEFVKYSALHAVTAAAAIVAVALLAWVGVRWSRSAPGRERRLRLAWIACLIAVQLATQIWWNLPPRLNPRQSLPFHLCDLVPWLAPFALFTHRRWTQTLLYFWGLGLSIWAFIMPILTLGPARLEYWAFWLGHTQIVGSAVYLVAVRSYRPRLRDVGVAALATVGYVALILPVDLALQADYGYVGRRSAAGELGPWPSRVLVLVALESVFFAALWAPWATVRRLAREGEIPR